MTDKYHTDVGDGISRTMLTTYATSPRLFEAQYITRTVPRPTTPALTVGKLVHTACLEPEKLTQYEVWKGSRRYGKEWESFYDRCREAGKESVTQAEYDTAYGCSVAVRNAIGTWISAATDREQEFRTKVGDLEIKCKADLMLDVAGTLLCVDIKTTQDEQPTSFAKDVYRYRYDWQDIHYTTCIEANVDRPVQFLIVAVRKTPPHTVQRYIIDDDRRAEVRIRWQETLERLSNAIQTGDYSGPHENRIYEVR